MTDDHDAIYAAGRARQGGRKAPAGGGYSNGGRVAKAAYGGSVTAEPVNGDPPPMEPPPPRPTRPPFMGKPRTPTPDDAVDP